MTFPGVVHFKRMEIDFEQWEDHDSEDGFDWELDRELAEAFGCQMDGHCMSGYRILMPAMNKSLKQGFTGEDVVNEIFITIEGACDAKLCECGKQAELDDDSTDDCPSCQTTGKKGMDTD